MKNTSSFVSVGIGMIIISLFLPWATIGSEYPKVIGLQHYGVLSLLVAFFSLYFAKKGRYIIVAGSIVYIVINSFNHFINFAETMYISEADIDFSKQVVSFGFYINLFGCFFTLLVCVWLKIASVIKK